MPRRGTIAKWDRLSPAYKARLARHGYTLEDYLAGRSRQAARGHARTPERPSRVVGREAEFQDYLQRSGARITQDRRLALARRIIAEIRPVADKFDVVQIYMRIQAMSPATVRLAESMSLAEWQEIAKVGAGRKERAALDHWTHTVIMNDEQINPFWYH